MFGGRTRTVPPHLTLFHYLGALALVLFAVELLTGALLMIYYRPSAGSAYSSVGLIMDEVRLGWLVHALHSWGAHFLLLLILLHVVRVYFSRAYRPPHQLNWAVGAALLLVVLALGFSGTLLPWDQRAFWYAESARRTLSDVPVLGKFLLGLFWGGWELGDEVLLRFYALHVGVLPWLAALTLGLHFVLVWRFGIAEPARRPPASDAPPMPFFPDFLVNVLMISLVVAGLLLSAAVLFPPVLAERADPLLRPSDLQPHWYLLPIGEVLRGLPSGLAAVAVLVFSSVFLLVPVLDRGMLRSRVGAILQRVIGLLVIAAWVALVARGYGR